MNVCVFWIYMQTMRINLTICRKTIRSLNESSNKKKWAQNEREYVWAELWHPLTMCLPNPVINLCALFYARNKIETYTENSNHCHSDTVAATIVTTLIQEHFFTKLFYFRIYPILGLNAYLLLFKIKVFFILLAAFICQSNRHAMWRYFK